jgi:hypothetical protein
MFVAWHALALRVPPTFSVRMFIIKEIRDNYKEEEKK